MIWPGCRLPFCQSLPGPHIYPFGGFSLNRVNWVKPCPRIRQISWKFDIPIIIDAAFLHNIQACLRGSGDVNVLQWNREWFFSRRVKFDSWFNVMAVYEVSWNGPKFIDCFTGIRTRVVRLWKWRLFWFSHKISLIFSSNWVIPYHGGRSQVLISSKVFDSSICDWKNKFSFFSGKYHLFRIESFRVDFVTLPNSTRVQSVSKTQSRQDFLSKLMDSWLVFRRDRVILNQWTKRNDRSIKRFSKASFTWSLPIRQEILNVSQIIITLHGICTPFFIQTWLQQYGRSAFLFSAHCLFQQSHLFLICVVSTYNDSRKGLHKLCRIPRYCQCKWL